MIIGITSYVDDNAAEYDGTLNGSWNSKEKVVNFKDQKIKFEIVWGIPCYIITGKRCNFWRQTLSRNEKFPAVQFTLCYFLVRH